jgi:uncharacterized membrane protein
MTRLFPRLRLVAFGSFVASSPIALSLGACNGRLDVIDEDIGGGAGVGGSGQGGSGGNVAGAAGSAGSGGHAASCEDGIRNGDETGVDCGGRSCPECLSGNACSNPVVECSSSVCTDGVCQPARCDDGVRNGDEEDIDCGGTSPCGVCLTLCHSQCAVSEALIPLGCDPSAPPPAGVASFPHSNDDGSIIAFDSCDDSARCTPFYWTKAEGPRAFAVTGGGIASGLSSDGQVVLVTPQLTLGAQSLLFSPDGSSVSTGMGPRPALLAANGAVVGVSPATSDAFNLFRRPPGGALEVLGELAFDADEIVLSGATPDASVIVGYAGSQALRYTASAGLVVGLNGLPETANGAVINALSRDGQVFAGLTLQAGSRVGVFRWTEAGGVAEIAPAIVSIPPGVEPTRMALSDDGRVLAFSGATDDGEEFGAFRWTQETGTEALTPGIPSVASTMSADGGVILGQTFDVEESYRGFIWTEAGGARSIRAALETAGVDLTGWTLSTPGSLSRDGNVALGTGTCGGLSTVYRLVLPE